jgi:hypothetical protein
MTLDEFERVGVNPALSLLPGFMDTPRARVMLFAIGLQESRFEHRRQMGNGPARGFHQFEQGGGVRGCINHPASAPHLRRLCEARGVAFDARAVWSAMENDDVLDAGIARLLLFTDPRPLPELSDVSGAWDCYYRNWRPGKPHRDTWDDYHQQAALWVLRA